MLKVGVTGGIGSGKSLVCQVFATLGIPVFRADDAAKYLMENDVALIHSIQSLLGSEVYENGRLNRSLVSDIVFRNPGKLQQLNALVHPATIKYSQKWAQQQRSLNVPYIIKEAAIFFETGSNKEMDVMIGVSAPLEIRIARALLRSNLAREDVLKRIAQQMDEQEKMSLCDYLIVNDGVRPVLPQVLKLNETLQA